MKKTLLSACAALSLLVVPAKAMEPVDTVLIMAIDVSRSVTPDRYTTQMEGYAKAFRDPQVVSSLQRNRVAVMLFEWAVGQNVVIPCQTIKSAEHAAELANQIANHKRASFERIGYWTGVERAMKFAQTSLESCPQGDRQVLDLSGDGEDNVAPSVDDVTAQRDQMVEQGWVINTLPVNRDDDPASETYMGPSNDELENWFRQNVQGGPGSFTIASSWQSLADVVRRKIMMDLASLR